MKLSKRHVYVTCIGSIGLVVLIGSLLTPKADSLALFLFCALAAAAEWTTATLLQAKQFSVELSIMSAVSFAAVLIFAPMEAGLVGTVGGATGAVVRAGRAKIPPGRAVRGLGFH